MTLHDRLLRSIRNAGADILRREDLVREYGGGVLHV